MDRTEPAQPAKKLPPRMALLAVRMPQHLVRKLEESARAAGIDRSAALRAALERGLR